MNNLTKFVISLFTLSLIILTVKVSSAQDEIILPKLKLNNSYRVNPGIQNNLFNKSIREIKSVNDFASADFKYQENKFLRDPKINFKLKTSLKKVSFNQKYIPWESKRRFWVAFSEMALLEFLPFSYSAYIKDWSGSTEKNWTKISFESMWHNISNGWIYDGDNFLTNFFAHPYHGNLFFNAGRTNGYNFWESSGFAMAGSAFWEQFMETWEPAFNDWVLTSMNGINLGEVLYRLSTQVTDNQARGSERMWLEIAGGILNPVRVVNRLISGETHKIFPNPSWRIPSLFEITLSGGTRRLDKNNGVNFASEGVQEGLFDMEIIYNNKFKKLNVPFSEFSLNMQVASGGPNFSLLQSNGNLFGFKLSEGKSTKQYFIQTLNYSYINNPGFLFGAASLNSNYLADFRTGKNSSIVTKASLALVPMGATPDDYFEGPEGRNYDFGPGVGFGLSADWRIGRWNIAELSYTSGWLWTQSEPSGSRHHLHYANAQLQYPMKDYFTLGIGAGVYWRESEYINDPDVTFTTPIVRVFIKTLINSAENKNDEISEVNVFDKNTLTVKKNWKKGLSDIILLEGNYIRNLSSFSEVYNNAYGMYGGYGKQFSDKFHLIFKSGYSKYDYKNETAGDSNSGNFSVVPVRIGGKYYVLNGIVMPFFSFYSGINFVLQDNNLNGVPDKQSLIRYVWEAGFGLSFKLFKQLNLDLSANYNDNFYNPDAMMTSFEYTGGFSFNLGK